MGKYVKEFPFAKEDVFGKIKFNINSYNSMILFTRGLVEKINKEKEYPFNFILGYVIENSYIIINKIFSEGSNKGNIYATFCCMFNNRLYIENYYFWKDDMFVAFIKEENGKWSNKFLKYDDLFIKKDLLLNKIFKIKYQARRK